MILDKKKLDQLVCNRNLVVVSGELTNSDRNTILSVLKKYNRRSNYVGQDHIETFFCDELSDYVKIACGIEDDPSIIFFKSGFIEYKLQGPGDLLHGKNDLIGIIITKLGIIL